MMADKATLTRQMTTLTDALDGFQTPDSSMLADARLGDFIDVGFGLLGHYQETDDIEISDSVMAALVDCAMCMDQIRQDGLLDAASRERAAQTMEIIERLVNTITEAIEQNIAARR